MRFLNGERTHLKSGEGPVYWGNSVVKEKHGLE